LIDLIDGFDKGVLSESPGLEIHLYLFRSPVRGEIEIEGVPDFIIGEE
jgi:hypothetical protein